MDERDWILERSRSSTYTFSSSSSSIRQSSFHPSNQPYSQPCPALRLQQPAYHDPPTNCGGFVPGSLPNELPAIKEPGIVPKSCIGGLLEFESLCCMPWNDGSFVVSKELLKRCGGEAFLGTARASLRRGCLLRLRGGGLRECLSHAVKGDEIVASSRPETSKKGFKSQH